MFNEMVFDKKIDLAATVLESAITNAENMDNIIFMESVDDFYMESEKLDKIKEGTKKFFDTIITAIKEFFEKIQKAIKEKINNAKINKAVNDIKKSGLKNLRKLKIKGVDGKTLKKQYKQSVELMAKITKKILNAKTTEEIDKYLNENEDKICKIINDVDKMIVDDGFLIDSFNPEDFLYTSIIQEVDFLSGGTVKKLNDLCLEQREKVLDKEKNVVDSHSTEENLNVKEDEIELSIEKEKALKKQASLISRLTKKVGSALSTTQGKIISAVVAAGAVASGAAGAKKNSDSKKHRPSSDIDFEESADDIIDSLFDDIDI